MVVTFLPPAKVLYILKNLAVSWTAPSLQSLPVVPASLKNHSIVFGNEAEKVAAAPSGFNWSRCCILGGARQVLS